MTVKHVIGFVCLLLCGMAYANAHTVSVRAWLDRDNMQLGETVTLNVQVQGDTGAAQPDFSALKQDFNLLGTQSSTSLNIVNGQTKSKLLWAIALQPKHAGKLTVPALDVDGKRTPPITLTVTAAAAGNGGKAGGDIYIETTIEPHQPYVQQQLRLTVKLYYAVNLTDGNMGNPHADGMVVRKLGQDSNYRAVVGGKHYRVVERHYALLPERSGKLTVSSIDFRGHVLDPRTIDLFMNSGRVVSARSNPIPIDVRPRPADSGNDVWLPARSVILKASGIDSNTRAQVGNPLTLTLRLQAQGLGFEQLPQLKLPDIPGADVYPDKTTTRNRDDGQWIYGERVRKFAIVPNRPGKLTLPAISIGWWDTAHDRAETTQVPAQTINVLPAAAIGTQPAAPAQPAGMHAAAASKSSPSGSVTAARSAIRPVAAASGHAGDVWPWRALAIVASVLWLLTLVAWILWTTRYRRSAPAAVPSALADDAPPGKSRVAFRKACQYEDWQAASRSLLAWARESLPRTRNLGELAATLDDEEQIDCIRELERVRYGGKGKGDGLGKRLGSAFASGPKFRASKKAATASPLPPLYPFRTGTSS